MLGLQNSFLASNSSLSSNVSRHVAKAKLEFNNYIAKWCTRADKGGVVAAVRSFLRD